MKRRLIHLLVVCVLMVASAYTSMLASATPTAWAPLLLAIGTNGIIMTLMALGATRGDTIPRSLVITFVSVFVLCAGAFSAALLMPPAEGAGGALFFGLPLRTAIVVYTVGVMPIVVLPLAYALTFDSSTLNDAHLAQVRAAFASVQAAPSHHEPRHTETRSS